MMIVILILTPILMLNMTTELMNISTYDFSGNFVTYLGLIGVISTLVILVSVFRSYSNSPLRK